MFKVPQQSFCESGWFCSEKEEMQPEDQTMVNEQIQAALTSPLLVLSFNFLMIDTTAAL